MALVWRKQQKETLFEVRSAGKSMRLYTNGVFHSQYNPLQPVSGGIWDLLLLPVFFYPDNQLKRILVLGVGGGAVLRQLNHFAGPDIIVGVELNPVHINIAKRFFGIRRYLPQSTALTKIRQSKAEHNTANKKNNIRNKTRIELYQADAIEWMNNYRGPPFDVIIDDLFSDSDGEPQRAVSANSVWASRLLSHLSPGGLLTINFVSRAESRASAFFHKKYLQKQITSAFEFSSPRYENVILALTGTESSREVLKKNLSRFRELDPRRKSSRLQFRVSQITV